MTTHCYFQPSTTTTNYYLQHNSLSRRKFLLTQAGIAATGWVSAQRWRYSTMMVSRVARTHMQITKMKYITTDICHMSRCYINTISYHNIL